MVLTDSAIKTLTYFSMTFSVQLNIYYILQLNARTKTHEK